MRSIFTIHAGEYLAAIEIESRFKKFNVWVPSKDKGIDLLVTNPKNQRMVSLQIKFSKDFIPNQRGRSVERRFKATGWWTHKRDKMAKSPADFWVFVLPSFADKDISYVVIPPKRLLRRLSRIHRTRSATIHSYFWVTPGNKCFETRDASKVEKEAMLDGKSGVRKRDFSYFLNKWDRIADKLK